MTSGEIAVFKRKIIMLEFPGKIASDQQVFQAITWETNKGYHRKNNGHRSKLVGLFAWQMKLTLPVLWGIDICA